MSDIVIAAAAYLVLSEQEKKKRKQHRWWNTQLFAQRGLSRDTFWSQLNADEGALFKKLYKKEFNRLSSFVKQGVSFYNKTRHQ